MKKFFFIFYGVCFLVSGHGSFRERELKKTLKIYNDCLNIDKHFQDHKVALMEKALSLGINADMSKENIQKKIYNNLVKALKSFSLLQKTYKKIVPFLSDCEEKLIKEKKYEQLSMEQKKQKITQGKKTSQGILDNLLEDNCFSKCPKNEKRQKIEKLEFTMMVLEKEFYKITSIFQNKRVKNCYNIIINQLKNYGFYEKKKDFSYYLNVLQDHCKKNYQSKDLQIQPQEFDCSLLNFKEEKNPWISSEYSYNPHEEKKFLFFLLLVCIKFTPMEKSSK